MKVQKNSNTLFPARRKAHLSQSFLHSSSYNQNEAEMLKEQSRPTRKLDLNLSQLVLGEPEKNCSSVLAPPSTSSISSIHPQIPCLKDAFSKMLNSINKNDNNPDSRNLKKSMSKMRTKSFLAQGPTVSVPKKTSTLRSQNTGSQKKCEVASSLSKSRNQSVSKLAMLDSISLLTYKPSNPRHLHKASDISQNSSIEPQKHNSSSVSKISTFTDRFHKSSTRLQNEYLKWEAKEAEECTFHPNISKRSVSILRKKQDINSSSCINHSTLAFNNMLYKQPEHHLESKSNEKRLRSKQNSSSCSIHTQSISSFTTIEDEKETLAFNPVVQRQPTNGKTIIGLTVNRVPKSFKQYRFEQEEADLNLMKYLNDKLNVRSEIQELEEQEQSSLEIMRA